jgi:sigma-E factor negative regulatory protein RseC
MSYSEHAGIVNKITEKGCEVLVTVGDACQGCHAKSVCSTSGEQGRSIFVRQAPVHLRSGDRVVVTMHSSLGLKAVLFFYIIPFITLIATLFISLAKGFHEALAALFSILSLTLCFLILYLFRQKIERTVEFKIKTLE